MIWHPNAQGYRCKPYTLIRNSRGNFAVYLDDTSAWRLLHAEIEGARAAKAFAEHWDELARAAAV